MSDLERLLYRLYQLRCVHLAVTAVTELTDNKRIIEDVPAEAH